MASIHRLSARTIATARQPGLLPDGGGLYLQVTLGADGKPRRSWVVRYTGLDGRRREMGLGSVAKVALADARDCAAAARKQLGAGVDPIDARFTAKAAARAERARTFTFQDCTEAYLEAHEAAWKNAKHRAQWRSTLETYAYPVMGTLLVRNIDVDVVMRTVEPIWMTKHETARRLLGRIESVLDWASVRGHRDGDNPARWRGHLQKALPSLKKATRVRHHPALPYAELPAFMTLLERQDGISARALEFCILTTTRTSEAIGARWEEIDLDGCVWRIPPARMKIPREHRIPLAPRAVKLLRDVALSTGASANSGIVFANARSGKALSNMALLATLSRLGRSDLTTHGFRSTFRDWASEQTDCSREVAEAALAHAIGNAVEAAYRRGDLFAKRRALMELWAAYCSPKPEVAATRPSSR